MTYYIYTLSDPTSKEIKYIGKTKNLKDRLSRHMNPSNLKNTWTAKSKWLKYLKNNNLKPMMEVLDTGDENDIDDLEIYWISQFKTWNFKLKNETEGGQIPTPKGSKLKKRHIKSLKHNHPNKKPVCQYTINNKFMKEYESITEAKKQTGLYHIGCCCKGKRKSAGDYYFRYKGNYFPYVKKDNYWKGKKHTKESLQKMKMNHPLRKEICQYDIKTDELINIFLSSYEASEKTKLHRGHISKCCRKIKNYNTVGGYYFRYKGYYFSLVKNNRK